MVEERELKCFRDEDGIEYFIAYDEGDVWRAWEEHLGESREDYDFQWEVVDPHVRLTILDDDTLDGQKTAVTKTVAEWIAEKGRGFLCSTEY